MQESQQGSRLIAYKNGAKSQRVLRNIENWKLKSSTAKLDLVFGLGYAGLRGATKHKLKRHGATRGYAGATGEDKG